MQLKDVLPIIVLAIFASSMIYLIDSYVLIGLPDIFRILIGTCVGIIVYLGIAFLFNMESPRDIRNLIIKK